jgi:hypothetical protein
MKAAPGRQSILCNLVTVVRRGVTSS